MARKPCASSSECHAREGAGAKTGRPRIRPARFLRRPHQRRASPAPLASRNPGLPCAGGLGGRVGTLLESGEGGGFHDALGDRSPATAGRAPRSSAAAARRGWRGPGRGGAGARRDAGGARSDRARQVRTLRIVQRSPRPATAARATGGPVLHRVRRARRPVTHLLRRQKRLRRHRGGSAVSASGPVSCKASARGGRNSGRASGDRVPGACGESL